MRRVTPKTAFGFLAIAMTACNADSAIEPVAPRPRNVLPRWPLPPEVDECDPTGGNRQPDAGWVEKCGSCDPFFDHSEVAFGAVEIGQRRTIWVTIENTSQYGRYRCPITLVELLNDERGVFSVSDPFEPDVPTGIAVTFEPKRPGEYATILDIIIAGDDIKFLHLPIHGVGRVTGEAQLCAEPTGLSFGTDGNAQIQDLSLLACGTSTVTVTTLSWDPADDEFSLVGAPSVPFTLAPGERRGFGVQHEAKDRVSDTAMISVRSSDLWSPPLLVPVTDGRAIAPPSAGHYLYYLTSPSYSPEGAVVRRALQGHSRPEVFWGALTTSDGVGLHPDPPLHGAGYFSIERGDELGFGGGSEGYRVSPDARYIALGDAYPNAGLAAIDLEDRRHFLAPGAPLAAHALSWNPNTRTDPQYQYVTSIDGDLYIGSLYTGLLRLLEGASDPNVGEIMPSWGPDGLIAFTSDPSNIGGDLELASAPSFGRKLYIIPETGGVATPVHGASDEEGAHLFPQFSPDGRWLAFTYSPSGWGHVKLLDGEVRIVDAHGSGRLLTLPGTNVGSSTFPSWSLDGKRLAFGSNRPGGLGGWDLWMVEVDPELGVEGQPVNLYELNRAEGDEYAPQWSR